MENKRMRHLMWILTWIAVGIGGALGAASVIMLSASRGPNSQSPDVVAGSKEPVLVNKPRPATPGRRLIPSHRHLRPIDLTD
jgi:hypothetical protein